MSEVKVNKLSPRSGTTVTLGDSGDTFTVPAGATFDASSATTTLPSTVVTTTGTQTLTNKTIDASQLTGTITPSDNTVSLAKLTATGTKDATTFLRGDNTFAEAGGGALVYLASATSSDVTSISLDGYFTSDYTHYKYIYSIYANTNNTDTQIRYRQSNADLTDANYRYVGDATYFSTSGGTPGSQLSYIAETGDTRLKISSADNTSDSSFPTTGELTLYNPLSTTEYKMFTTHNIGHNSASPPSAWRNWCTVGYYVGNTSALSGISFLYDGGNISGTVTLYGIKNS